MRINTLDEEYKLILRHLLGHGVTNHIQKLKHLYQIKT
jgi:hypothetical protein